MAKTATLTPAPTTTTVADQTFDAGPMGNVSDFDPVDILPAAAAEKLLALRQRANDLHKMVPQFEELSEVNIARIKAQGELARLTNTAHDNGFGLAPTDPRVVSAQRKVTKLNAEAQRLQERSEKRAQAWHTASRVLANVENWLGSGRPGDTQLESVEVEPVKLLKGEDLVGAIERLRRRGRELRADFNRIESAPYPSSHAKQRMREQVEILAQRGEANVAALIEHADGKLVFQRELLRVQLHNIRESPAAIGYGEAINPGALVAWLFKEALIKRLDAEIDSEADDKVALSPEAREEAQAEVMADLLAVERDECALAWQAQAQNLPCEHRPDIAPLAVLQCRLVTAPRVVPTITPELHSYAVAGQ
jgi:hypothetical protein